MLKLLQVTALLIEWLSCHNYTKLWQESIIEEKSKGFEPFLKLSKGEKKKF